MLAAMSSLEPVLGRRSPALRAGTGSVQGTGWECAVAAGHDASQKKNTTGHWGHDANPVMEAALKAAIVG